jgi:hypothetical protein
VFSSNNDPFYFSSELKVFSSYILLVISWLLYLQA